MTRGLVAWFTGLSGSGKSTIARRAGELLGLKGFSVEILDGDQLRRDVGAHLGFSVPDVLESSRLAIEVCAQLRERHDVVLVPRIAPLRKSRAEARQALGQPFIEVYVHASLDSVAARDPKGLYLRSRSGEGAPLIGTPGGVPFEPPESPELVLDTDAYDEQTLSQRLTDYILTWLEHHR